MNETEQLWFDLLNEWHDNTNGVGTPEISLENQAKYLAKKHPISIQKIVNKVYDQASEETIETEEDRVLVCFKQVICKYRPHLHMGDYWLDIEFVNGVQNYRFYAIRTINNEETIVFGAKHPHISNTKPCLGTYQGDLGTAFVAANYIQFMSIMRAFLGTYTGNDTYTRGTQYKKRKLHCMLHSRGQILDIFSEEAKSSESIDVWRVAEDPMRWNWPKDLTAWNTIQIQGQDMHILRDYWNKTNYPWLNGYRTDWGNYNTNGIMQKTNKILGYVSIAHKIGELPLMHAFEFVRIFLMTLQGIYEGSMDAETLKRLKKLTNNIYDAERNRYIKLNSRYQIHLDEESLNEIRDMWKSVEPFYRRTGDESAFVNDIKWAGDKLTNFVVLLRKQAPYKAGKGYLQSCQDSIPVDDLDIRYRKIRKSAVTIGLQQLEKDKRRFINELNKPEISNTIPDVGQGTLFS